MTFTHSRSGILPFARFDGIPYTILLVEESASPFGPFVLIASLSITADPTPSTPDPINETWTTAVLSSGYYRFAFDVIPSNPSPYTAAVLDPDLSAPQIDGSVASYARMYLGGENWDVLVASESYGLGYITLAVETVKRRVLASPPPTLLEPTLNPYVLDYLGICTALQLITALRSAWSIKIVSRSVNASSAEITTYTDRARLVEKLQDDLRSRLPAIQQLAVPYLDVPITSLTSQPSIDEQDFDLKVTGDPRRFPPATTYPYRPLDDAAYALFRDRES